MNCRVFLLHQVEYILILEAFFLGTRKCTKQISEIENRVFKYLEIRFINLIILINIYLPLIHLTDNMINFPQFLASNHYFILELGFTKRSKHLTFL